MPYCDQCQIIHGEEHRFCQRCGQLLKSSRNAASRGCARCGSPTFPGQKFCTECGLPLRVARVSQQEEEYEAERPPLFYPRRTEPMPRRRARRPGRILSLLGVFLLVAGVWYAWTQIKDRPPVTRTPPTTSAPKDDLKPEVGKLAEKIRAAHLSKDINKWVSCYSSSYPNLGQVERQILEFWNIYDIKSIDYRISNIQRLGDAKATANITWNFQLYNHSTQDLELRPQSYTITIAKSGNDWKIVESKEAGGGTK